jgi:LPS-assembly protein
MLLSVSRAAIVAAMVFACVFEIAHAQEGQGLKLQHSLGAPPSGRDAELPTFVTADRIEGLGEFEVEASGDAELRRGDKTLLADRIRYVQDTDEAEATGNVRLRVVDDEIRGPRLRLRLSDTTGIFDRPTFRLSPRAIRQRLRGAAAMPQLTAQDPEPQMIVEGRGDAQAFRFEGTNRYRVTEGKFTTCRPGQDDWFVEFEELNLDMEREVGTARNAQLTFFGVSTPRIAWFDFSLNNDRKSGFLPPTFGAANTTGINVLVPYYWNIAPNYDATITPRYMARRGVQLLNEFRFLQPWFRGQVRYEILPEDRATGERR